MTPMTILKKKLVKRLLMLMVPHQLVSMVLLQLQMTTTTMTHPMITTMMKFLRMLMKQPRHQPQDTKQEEGEGQGLGLEENLQAGPRLIGAEGLGPLETLDNLRGDQPHQDPVRLRSVQLNKHREQEEN